MAHPRLKGWQPVPAQRALLRVLLEADPERVRHSGPAWLETVDLERIDLGSSRLLALLYWRLMQAGVAHPEMPRLKGVYRHAWARNQQALHRLLPLAGTLADAGIPTTVLKGVAQAFAVYPDPGTRPMDDVDLLVRWSDAGAAIQLLERAGFTRLSPWPVPTREWADGGAFWYNYAAHFMKPQGLHVDLHWHCLNECCYRGADDSFWERRREIRVQGQRLWALALEDQLFHILVHGASANLTSSIRWIVDATLLIRQGGDRLRWDVLIAEARRRTLSHALAEALTVLAEFAGGGVPPAVIAELRAQVSGRLEKWAFRSMTSTRQRNKGPALWLRFVRATPGFSGWQRLRFFYGFLRARSASASALDLARHAFRRIFA